MQLDVPTLMAMGSFVSACAAMVLFVAWWQNKKILALELWALGDASAAGGILSLILAVVLRQPLLSILGGSLLALAPGLMWKAAREFDAKPASVVVALLGVVVVGLANAIPFTRDITGSLTLAISTIYYLAIATTLWIGRTDRLAARLPILLFLAVHAAVMSIGTYSTLVGAVSQNAVPSVMSLFGIVHFENNIFTVGTAVFILALVKERNEAVSARVARTDGLTGIANRATFLESAERVMERCRHECALVSVMMFDLDRFKAVNDTHGHAVGDDVLRKFGQVLAKALRPNDVFGRIGGEEFAVVLPGSGIEAACVRAERIRASFAENCRFVADRQVDPTVSCGVSVSENAEQPLSALLEHADIALYRAKAAGRNCVEHANQPEAKAGSSTVLRIA